MPRRKSARQPDAIAMRTRSKSRSRSRSVHSVDDGNAAETSGNRQRRRSSSRGRSRVAKRAAEDTQERSQQPDRVAKKSRSDAAHNKDLDDMQSLHLELFQAWQNDLLSEAGSVDVAEICSHYDGSNTTATLVLVISLLKNFGIDESFPFDALFRHSLELLLAEESSTDVRSLMLEFFSRCLGQLDNPRIRAQIIPLTRISCWVHLSGGSRDTLFDRYPHLNKPWASHVKKYENADADTRAKMDFDRSFIYSLLVLMVSSVENEQVLVRGLDMVWDLLSQLPTRMYINSLVVDSQLVPMLEVNQKSLSPLVSALTKRLKQIIKFDIDDFTGAPPSWKESMDRHTERLVALQKLVFRHEEWRDLMSEFCLGHIALIEKPENLARCFSKMTHDDLIILFEELQFRTRLIEAEDKHTKEFLVQDLVFRFAKHENHVEEIKRSGTYATEDQLWNPELLSMDSFSRGVLSLPKIGLQFLSVQDYLCRNYELLALESQSQLRSHLEAVTLRMKPRPSVNKLTNWTDFGGWSPYAVQMSSFDVVTVARPNVGESVPAKVWADLSFSISRFGEETQREWDRLRPNDVLYLISVKAPAHLSLEKWTHVLNGLDAQKRTFKDFFNIEHVRGCQIVEFLTDKGTSMNDDLGKPIIDGLNHAENQGGRRMLRVALDPRQFEVDAKNAKLEEDTESSNTLYASFNLLVRRRPQENNSKHVLEAIKRLIDSSSDSMLPTWFQDLFLGYGDPMSSHYSRVIPHLEAELDSKLKEMGIESGLDGQSRLGLLTVNFGETLLDMKHLKESFPEAIEDVEVVEPDESDASDRYVRKMLAGAQMLAEDSDSMKAPLIVTFNQVEEETTAKKSKKEKVFREQLMVESEAMEFVEGTSLSDYAVHTALRFSEPQVKAIKSGCLPGLTLIVGPPGTGKTEVAVQIVSNLHKTHPEQRTVILANSNRALDTLFEKLLESKIEKRYLMRLGWDYNQFPEGDKRRQWSKLGRIKWFEDRRVELLGKVEILATSLSKEVGAVAYSCETALSFYHHHLVSAWHDFEKGLDTLADEEVVARFPFLTYFQQGQVLSNASSGDAKEVVRSCWRNLERLFSELRELQAFEVLRSNFDRSQFLLTKQAKIIAMTTTHAAIHSAEFADLKFQYDNLIIEEAAQMTDIDTFIPLVFGATDKVSSLKRIVLLGDHHQLPPVVRNPGVREFSHMGRSLFERLIRLGAPVIEFRQQGRCRPSIRNLYAEMYQPLLKDFDQLAVVPEFKLANAGFAKTYQFVNVDQYMDQDETQPRAHYYQNLGEAEYVVQVYMFMRLLGYPRESIAILTTYRGQKDLIQDVMTMRCGEDHSSWGSFFGICSVFTVDEFQGQQADYVLASLVRTSSVGHLSDRRRLLVLLSRARLGLYLFGRREIYLGKQFDGLRGLAGEEDSDTLLQLVANETSVPQVSS